jgi:hypothetical protein
MSGSGFVALASPFDRVKFQCDAYWSHIRFTYTGTPDDLLAAGAIEAGMASPAPNKRRRIDSFGDKFWRDRSGYGARVRVIRLITTVERALALPGVTSDSIPKELTWLIANPDRIHVEEDDWRICCLGAHGVLEAAGFQRSFARLDSKNTRMGDPPWPSPAMNGFWVITVEKLNSDATTNREALSCATQLATSFRIGRPVSPLRLVYQNPGVASSEPSARPALRLILTDRNQEG